MVWACTFVSGRKEKRKERRRGGQSDDRRGRVSQSARTDKVRRIAWTSKTGVSEGVDVRITTSSP